jgi:RNA polymerase sigma-70 factor (ECF subfamily)
VVPELALEDLFASFSPIIRAQVQRATRDAALADDVLQETFLAALVHRDRLDPERLRGWLLVVARSRMMDALRSRGRGGEFGGSVVVADEAALVVDRVVLEQALASLEPSQRQVVTDVLINGLTSAEVARRAGIPQGTVRSRLHYAVAELRRRLDGGDG